MYEVFGDFLNTPTWHVRDTPDEQRFYAALNKVVWSDDFEPDDMREYMRGKVKLPANDSDSDAAEAIERYCQDAWAVVDFIKYAGIAKR